MPTSPALAAIAAMPAVRASFDSATVADWSRSTRRGSSSALRPWNHLIATNWAAYQPQASLSPTSSPRSRQVPAIRSAASRSPARISSITSKAADT